MDDAFPKLESGNHVGSYIEYGPKTYSLAASVHDSDDSPVVLATNSAEERRNIDLVGFRFLGGTAILSPAARECLSLRQRQITVLLAAGIEIEDVSNDLGISDSTFNDFYYEQTAPKLFADGKPTAPSLLLARGAIGSSALFVVPKPESATHFHARLSTLSPRQRQVADLRAEGYSTEEVGKKLHITRSSTKTHLSNANKKLGIGSRRLLTAAYFVGGILHSEIDAD